MSTTPSTVVPPPPPSSSSSPSAELLALKARLRELEAKKKTALNTNANVAPSSAPSPTPVPSSSPANVRLTPTPTPTTATLPTSTPTFTNYTQHSATATTPTTTNGHVNHKRTALEEAKALLAAKIAARDRDLALKKGGNASTQLSASATPFVPAYSTTASSSSSSSSSSTASSSVAATAASSTPVPPATIPTTLSSSNGGVSVPPKKPLLCRSWLTCTFGQKCRYRHPTIASEPFFEYGGRVLLHLNAIQVMSAASAGITPPATHASTNATMPPVLLVVLALMTQARTDMSQSPSMPLATLWSSLRDQLGGLRDLPANQDDLLNMMGLPTTAGVMVRAAEGQPVLSTDAFRNMYASVFCVTRSQVVGGGTGGVGSFVVSHLWDEEKRARLQEAADQAEALKKTNKPRNANTNSYPSTTAGGTMSASSSSASSSAADSYDLDRKRKRVPDSVLGLSVASNGVDANERASKMSRLGALYPEDAPSSITAMTMSMNGPHTPSTTIPTPMRSSRPIQPGTVYSLDAGSTLGGSTAFVRGGIVTELSLLAKSTDARTSTQSSSSSSSAPPVDLFEDEFTRAIRRQREVSTHATYTVRTKKISSGKGFEMLQKMNWRHGQGLGKRQQGRVEPVEVTFRADRTGL